MQDMIDALGPKGARAWDILAGLHDKTLSLGKLYDQWVESKRDLTTLRQSLRAVDVEPLVEEYLRSASCSEDTKSHYRALIRRLVPFGKPYPIGQLTRERVQKMIDELKGRSSTKRKAGAAVRSFSNWLIARGYLQDNPVRHVKLPKPATPRTLYLDVPDVERLLEALPKEYRAFEALLAGSGIEVSVALSLRVRDVYTEKKEIRARGTKSHARDRVVRVADWAWPAVRTTLIGKLPDALLFDRIPDRWVAGKVHRTAIESLEKEYPIFKGYTMRDHRHTYAVRAIRAGAPADIVSRQLGHANPTLLLTVYGRFVPTSEERAKWEKRATAMDLARADQMKKREGKK
ncbi:MAG: tyrosine-type recombinase/integrase [Gemmatimonadota bacterium]|nr:tyrosine-type recombinase/integrase [Gemmatimonadota bacterium]